MNPYSITRPGSSMKITHSNTKEPERGFKIEKALVESDIARKTISKKPNRN